MKAKALLRASKLFLINHGPEIATGLGIGIAFAAGVKAVKETPKAVELIEDKKEEKKKEGGEDELTVVETVQTTWKCYLPSVVMFILAAVLIIGGQRATARKAAAFATAYQLSEQMLQEYKDAAKEIVGEKKANEIEDQAAIQQVRHNPPVQSNIIFTGKGKWLCLDSLSNHYFYSNAEHIRQDFKAAITDVFAEDPATDFIGVSEWYYQCNLREAYDMDLSQEVGWNRSDAPKISFTSVMGTDEYEDIPILVVKYSVRPHYDKNNPNHAYA